jgi:crotonobetainyl-CoA:carnitine CoA-transferase CaiB-like acyl-CoA transferase
MTTALSAALPDGPLSGLRVIDASTIIAGPLCALLLGDMGAEVVKIEHPVKGDPIRGHGPSKDGVSLWWKFISRNKYATTLDLSKARGQELFRDLVRRSDVVVENFRPGTLERWNLDPTDLLRENPRLVVARVTGFGQHGPYSTRAGFGTLAEAMSGFAMMTGEADGPPTLPPFGLADGIAGLATAFAVLAAVRARTEAGAGQVIDMAIIEPILTILGPQPLWYDQLGIIPQRVGNRSDNNAPRNTYRTRDGKWIAVSTSADSVARRVMELIGRAEIADENWFATGIGRAAHADELDKLVSEWILARDFEVVISEFERAGAAACGVYDVSDVMSDPQYVALNSIVEIEDDELGIARLQNVMCRLSGTPGAVRWLGRQRGNDNEQVFGQWLGRSSDELVSLKQEGVV